MTTYSLIILLVSVVCVYAQGGGFGGGGGHHHHHLEEYHDSRAPPHYKFDYEIHDGHTHDFHGQAEHREHHKLRGMYWLHQPDGRKRVVEYEADKHGINYKVHYEGKAHHEAGHHHHGHH